MNWIKRHVRSLCHCWAAAVDAALKVKQRLPISPPIPEPVQNVIGSVTIVPDLVGVVSSLERVMWILLVTLPRHTSLLGSVS
jgi:hypothetical protein